MVKTFYSTTRDELVVYTNRESIVYVQGFSNKKAPEQKDGVASTELLVWLAVNYKEVHRAL